VDMPFAGVGPWGGDGTSSLCALIRMSVVEEEVGRPFLVVVTIRDRGTIRMY
jgi:hypothetical protein